MGYIPWILGLIQLLAAVVVILMIIPPLYRRQLSLWVWFGKSVILTVYLLFICVDIFH